MTSAETQEPLASARPSRIVGIGASAGGLSALRSFLRELPTDTGLGYVVVAHLTGALEQNFVPLLQSHVAVPVVQAVDGMVVEADHVYVVASHTDVVFRAGTLQFCEPDAGNGGRAPVDRFLRSVADAVDRNACAVILSGNGSDGSIGLKRVKEVGGLTFAQDPDDAEHDGMPRSAISTGLVDLVVPAAEIPRRLLAIVRDPGARALAGDDVSGDASVAEALRAILNLVRLRSGHDFSHYKRATLLRRIARRMQVCETPTIAGYYNHLRGHQHELTGLLRDFLISVTNFFRDPEVFRAMQTTVIPQLFAGKDAGSQIRIWVPGCATGEEAYSLAILCAEHAARLEVPLAVQIFASDIDEEALVEARAGYYPETVAADVDAARLARYFVPDAGGYRIRKEIRDTVLFSSHNLLRDSPFSRLDLVSCRNLLIYLNREAQDRVFGIFHFALTGAGYLLLGSSESAENGSSLFSLMDGKHRIFTRRPANLALPMGPLLPSLPWTGGIAPMPSGNGERLPSLGEFHLRLIEEYAPPSVVVNEDGDVVHLSASAGRYLGLSGGALTRQLLRLVREDLRLDLRAAMHAVREPGQREDARKVRIKLDGEDRLVEVRVRVFDSPDIARGTLLVMFAEGEAPSAPPPTVADALSIEPMVRQLEEDLQRTRHQLRTSVEQYETSVEELKASNEELHAMNEELRSTSEELETGKEELQSVNEELTTLNHELKNKVDEVSRANADLQNLMTSTQIGVVFLDRGLRIQRFTPRVQDLFNIIPSDLGRPLTDLTHRLDREDLADHARSVLRSLDTLDLETHSDDGRHYLLRINPYRSMTERVEGVVLTFLDITQLEQAEAARRVSEDRFRLALRAVPVVVLNQDVNLRYTWGYMQGGAVDFIGKTDAELFTPAEAAHLTELKRSVLTSGNGRRDEVELTVAGQVRHYAFNLEAIRGNGDQIVGVASAAIDVTANKLSERTLRDADRRKDEFLATLAHELRNPLAPLRAALDIQQLAGDDMVRIDRARAIMERQVRQLVRLVDDLLDVSRITQGKILLRLATTELARIVADAVEAAQPTISQFGHQIEVQVPAEPVELDGDHVRLVQVVTNLLTNAARYTPAGGRITLTGTIVRPGVLMVTVRDNGIGIGIEVLPHVFDMFSQAGDPLERAQGGLGIGLNLVRRLVELHGGTVEARSAGKGQGSEFVVELPTARAKAPAMESLEKRKRPTPGVARRVLVVDDNPDVTLAMSELITMLGHECREAGDGPSALAVADAFHPEVVLLDIGLPGLSGYEVARRLRAAPQGKELMIVAISGWGQPEDVERGVEAGFDHHLVKPASMAAIREALGEAR